MAALPHTRRMFARSLVSAAVVSATLILAGCGSSSISSANLPSQSGTLANTATATTTAPRKKFNPFVQNDSETPGRRFIIEKPTMADVLQTAGLEERSLGSPNAPITVVKYASMTCPFCRQFQKTTFPKLKKRYIDTGKVRFILREFPIGFQSGTATIALRCVAPDKYFAAYDALMKSQRKWVSQDVRREPVWQVVRKFGLSRQAFDACYQDKTLTANLNAVKERGRTLGVIGTPNFFINNKLYKRVLTMTDFDQVVADGPAVTASVKPPAR